MKIPEKIKNELEILGLEIIAENGKLYVRTFEDRSVGIYGDIISPELKDIDEFIWWWDTITGLFWDR